MESYLLWGYFHILLFVFWLGGDIGVFLSAIYAKRSDLSFETRATIMQLGLVIDFLPRLCFALIFPVGLHLTNDLGLLKINPPYFFLAWFISFSWILIIILIGKNEGKPIAENLSKIQFWMEGLLGTFLVFVGIMSYSNEFLERWFSLKIILFGLVFYAAMAIDICFRPFIKPFMEIGTEGSTPEREAAVSLAINKTLIAVFTLYVLIALIAFLGKVKPL